MMDKFLQKKVRIEFTDGQVLTGRLISYTTSEDNDDEGDYYTLRADNGQLEGQHIEINPDEVKKVSELS
ncbi:hypothetical protein [Lacticaseibacillus saniviri]